MAASLAVQVFLNRHLPVLCQHLRDTLIESCVSTELQEWIWQVLGEWQSLQVPQELTMAAPEPMFWHCLFYLHFLEAEALDELHLEELVACLDYFELGGTQPVWCVGFRPMAEDE